MDLTEWAEWMDQPDNADDSDETDEQGNGLDRMKDDGDIHSALFDWACSIKPLVRPSSLSTTLTETKGRNNKSPHNKMETIKDQGPML